MQLTTVERRNPQNICKSQYGRQRRGDRSKFSPLTAIPSRTFGITAPHKMDLSWLNKQPSAVLCVSVSQSITLLGLTPRGIKGIIDFRWFWKPVAYTSASGSDVDSVDLEMLVSSPAERHVIRIDNYQMLASVVDQLKHSLCPGTWVVLLFYFRFVGEPYFWLTASRSWNFVPMAPASIPTDKETASEVGASKVSFFPGLRVLKGWMRTKF